VEALHVNPQSITLSEVDPAFTWAGVLAHLSGVHDHSGRNGLATWQSVRPPIDLLFVDFTWRGRYYGEEFTGVRRSVQGSPWRFIFGPLRGGVGIGVNFDVAELSLGITGEFDLLSVFRLMRTGVRAVRGLAWAECAISSTLSLLPDIRIQGELTLQVGVSERGIAYCRLQTGAGLGFSLPLDPTSGSFDPDPTGSGRSWQIQFARFGDHIPRVWR
jgi:hypothetical protein